jgi:gentisate 1,2-dioxygenase
MNALENFNRELADKHMLGFWNAGNIAETYQPKASYEPYIWRWQDVYDGLVKAGELLTLEQTARRFIGFHTPNKFRTTHTLGHGRATGQAWRSRRGAPAHHGRDPLRDSGRWRADDC